MCYDLASDEAAKKRWRNKVRICRSNSQSHNPLIPGLLVHNEWAGTFEEFEEAVELGDLEAFLRLDTNDRRTPASGLPLPKQAQPPQVPITNAKLPPAPTLMPPLAAPGQSVRILQDNDDILSFLPQETTITDTEVDALLRELEKPLPRTARRTYTPSSRAKTDGPKPLPILPKDRPQATGQPAKYDPDAMLSKNLVSEAARAIGVTPTPRKFAPRMRLNKRPIEQIMSERRARTEQTENTRKNDELFSSLGLSDMKISEEEADAFLNDGIIPAPRRQESSSSKPNTANHAKHGEDSRITDETSRADSKYEPNNFSDAAQPSSKDVEAPVVPDEVGANQDRPCDQPVSTSVTDGSDNVSEPKDADDVLNTSSEQDSTSVENAEEASKSTRPDAPVISKNDILEDQVAHKALDEKTMSFKGVSGEDANKPLSNDGLHKTSSTDISNDQMAINSVSLSNKLRSTEEAAVTSTCKQPFLERTEKEAADLVGLHDKEQKESDVYATSKSEIKPEKHTHQPIHHHFIVRRKDSLNNELAKKCTAEDHALSEKLTTDKVSKDELFKIDGCHKPLDSLSLPESDGCTSEIRLTDAEQKNRVSASESNQKAGQVAQPELGSELDAEHEHEHEPESKPEPEPEEVPEVGPEAKPESQPERGPESKPEPEPEEVPEVEPEAKPESQPEPELESKPLLEPKFVPEHKSEAKPDSETEAESKPKVESEPEEVLEAAPKPKPEAAPEPAPVHEGLTEPEPVLEPVPKPESEAVPGVEDIPEAVLEPEPAEVSAPVPKSRVVVEAEAEAVPEAVPEPNSAQETIPKPEPVQHPELRSRARAVPFVEGETLATLDSNNNQSSDSLDVEPKKSLYVPEAKRAPDHSSENDSQVQMADTLSDTPHIESSDAPEKQATLVHDAGFKIKDSPQPDEAQQQGRTDSSIKEDEATESTRLSANSVPDADTVEEFNKEFASGSNQPESKSVNLAGNQLDHDAKKESADINLTASSHEGTQNDTDLTESIKPTAASAKVGNDQHDGMSHDVTRGSENPMKSDLLFGSGLDSKDEIYESQNEPEHTSLSSSVLSRDNKLDQHDDGHNFISKSCPSKTAENEKSKSLQMPAHDHEVCPDQSGLSLNPGATDGTILLGSREPASDLGITQDAAKTPVATNDDACPESDTDVLQVVNKPVEKDVLSTSADSECPVPIAANHEATKHTMRQDSDDKIMPPKPIRDDDSFYNKGRTVVMVKHMYEDQELRNPPASSSQVSSFEVQHGKADSPGDDGVYDGPLRRIPENLDDMHHSALVPQHDEMLDANSMTPDQPLGEPTTGTESMLQDEPNKGFDLGMTQSVQDTLDQQAKTPGDSLMASVEAMTSTQSSIASPSQKTSLAERLQRATKTPPAIPPAKRGTDTPMEPDAKLDIWANKSVQDPVSIQGASTETAISKETAEISECDGDVTTRIHPELDSAGGMDRSLDYLPQDRPEHHTAASDHASLEDTAESLGATSNSSSSDDETDSNIPDLWVTSKLTAENPHEISLDQSRGINDARRPRTEHPFKEQSAAPVERTPELALQRQMENVTLASSPQAQAATPRDDSRTDIPAGDIRCVASKPAVHVSATVTERDLPTPPPLIRPQRHTNPRSRIPPPAESTSNDAQVPAAKPPSLPPRRVRRDLKETRAVSEMPPQALLAPTQPPSLPHRMRSDAAAGENARRIVSETPGFGAARSEDISSTKSPRARRTLSDIMREADQILQEWK